MNTNSDAVVRALIARLIDGVVNPPRTHARYRRARELAYVTDLLCIDPEIYDLDQRNEERGATVRECLKDEKAYLEPRVAEDAAKDERRQATRKLKAIREARRLGTAAPAPEQLAPPRE